MSLSIVIIDDHEIFRRGISQLINQTLWGKVVADTDNLDECLKLLTSIKPNILLLDLYIGRNNKSFDVITKIKTLSPLTKIVLLTISEDDEDIFQAAQYNIDGYLLKSTPFSTLETYLQEISQGKIVISDSLGSNLFKKLQKNTNLDTLTKREKEVLKLIQDGLSNKDMAKVLFISENTIKIHVSKILEKSGAVKRSQLIARNYHSINFGKNRLST